MSDEQGNGHAVYAAVKAAAGGKVTHAALAEYIMANTDSLVNLLHSGAPKLTEFAAGGGAGDAEISEDAFLKAWGEAEAEKRRESAEELTKGVKPGQGEADKKEAPPTRQKPPPSSYQEIVPDGADFKFSLGHQEMTRVMKHLDLIFSSQPCDWLPVEAMANLLSVELGYEDTAEFEDALGGPFSEFVKGLPNAELSTNERGTAVLRLKEDVEGPPRKMTLKVTERRHLWHVLMQAGDAAIEIPELEFEFSPMGERRIDTLYNHIAAAVWNLGMYVKQQGVNSDTADKICDTIMLLNKALDVEHPFTIVVRDPTSRSLWQPIDEVEVEYLDGQAQAQAA